MQRKPLLTAGPSEAGMTVIELLVVMFVMAIVLTIASTTFFSLSQTANRNNDMATDEQQASTVLLQVSRDIRSAHQVTFAAFSSPVPTEEIEMQLNQPAGTFVEWIYTPTALSINGFNQPANSLVRYSSTSATGPFTASAPEVTTPVEVANGTTTPVFRYFQGNGSEITSIDSPSSLQTCTTRVSVTLNVATEDKVPAVATFTVSDAVAITDQEAQWATLPCS